VHVPALLALVQPSNGGVTPWCTNDEFCTFLHPHFGEMVVLPNDTFLNVSCWKHDSGSPTIEPGVPLSTT
jgi:hypothetical protein